MIADLTAEMNRDTAFEEKDITSYLLRRNFATAMISVCGMEEDELQYLMGHDILDEQEVRSDFTDADFLARIWRKMNRRVLRENIPDEDKPIVMDQGECVAEGRSTMVVEVAAECFQDGNETVVLDLWNELPGDFISVRPNEQGDAGEDDITLMHLMSRCSRRRRTGSILRRTTVRRCKVYVGRAERKQRML